METLLFARALMGVSLAFHIIYAAIGVGLPFMLMLAEGLALFRGQEIYHEMARRWIRPAGRESTWWSGRQMSRRPSFRCRSR